MKYDINQDVTNINDAVARIVNKTSMFEYVAQSLVDFINSTGGCYRFKDGDVSPIVAPHLTVLGEAYLAACEALEVKAQCELSEHESAPYMSIDGTLHWS